MEGLRIRRLDAFIEEIVKDKRNDHQSLKLRSMGMCEGSFLI